MARSRSASGNGKDRRRCVIPGIWEAQRTGLLDDIKRGDPRIACDFAPSLTEAERQAVDASPGSGPSMARRHLVALGKDGWTVTGAPSASEFPAVASIPWLADRSVRLVRVFPDDSIEPVASDR